MLFVSTASANVPLPDLGITLLHPVVDYQLDAQFTPEDIRLSWSLTSAILAGTLIWRRTAGGPIEPAANYDPNYLSIAESVAGSGINTAKEYTLAASTIALNLSSEKILIFSGTTPGQILRLPSCLTAPSGSLEYIVYNRGSASIALQYQDGSLFFTIPAYSKTVMSLQYGNSANGDWFLIQSFNNIASGIVNYKVVASASFSTTSLTDVIITGFSVTPIAGEYLALYSASCANTLNNSKNYSTIYAAGTAVADSTRTCQSVSSNFEFLKQTQTVAKVNGAQAFDVRVSRSSGTYSITNRTLILVRLGA